MLLGVAHGAEDAHVGGGNLEVEFGVLLDVRGLRRFGQHDGALLQEVADAQLWCADAVAGRNVGDLGMVDDEAVSEGGVRLDDDVVLGALPNGGGRVESDEPADLVDHGLRLARREEAVEVLGPEVRYADGPGPTAGQELLHGLPDLSVLLPAILTDLVPGPRSVDEVEVEIVEADLAHRGLELLERLVIGLRLGGQLRGDVDFLTRNARVAHRLSDRFLVVVGAGRVDVAVADPQGVGDGGVTLIALLEQPGAEPDLGNLVSVAEGRGLDQYAHLFSYLARGTDRQPRHDTSQRVRRAVGDYFGQAPRRRSWCGAAGR